MDPTQQKRRLTLNRIISALIFADLALLAGWGLVAPIASVFITEHIIGGTLAAIGAATAIFWFTRSILQIPIATYLDRVVGEQAEFHALILGLLISAVAAFLLPLATSMAHIYLIEFVHAVGYAFYIPAWSALFTHHLDPEHTALEWALDRSVGGMATGTAGLLGGIIANAYGFNWVFFSAGVLCLVGLAAIMFGPTFVMPEGLRTVRRPWRHLFSFNTGR